MSEPITPVELHEDIWLKREDLYRAPSGANGSKYRAAQAILRGINPPAVVTAASVRSPQHIITATVAAELGIPCTVVVGGTKRPLDHPSVRAAAELGAEVTVGAVGYNTYLQSYGRDIAQLTGAFQMPYGLACPPELDPWEVFASTARQASALPAEVTTLVVPFGSTNTALGILMGLPTGIAVKFVSVGNVTLESFAEQARRLNVPYPADVEFTKVPWSYSESRRGAIGSVKLHPTYEGKVLAHLDAEKPSWWRAENTALWVVGGPLS